MIERSGPVHGRALRKGRHSIPGQVYLVTMVTASRVPLFLGLYEARCAVRALYDADVCRHAKPLAHVVMPDHVHWIFELENAGDLSAAVRLYKAKVSVALGYRIWQRGFHDRALRAQDDVVKVSRYVVANPLRAGLVAEIGDYPHWDAVWLTGD